MRSKLRGKRDANQELIVARFRQNYLSVADAADLGDDFPDLVVAYGGFTCLVEVKMPGRELEPGQARFRDEWRGAYRVARTADDADEISEWVRKQASKLG